MAEQERRTQQERAQTYAEKEHGAFLHNAFFIFNKATEIAGRPEFGERDLLEINVSLLKKMLHSILFFGNIHKARCQPDEIFADDDIYDMIFHEFPNPFERYRQDVPLRTPFSYFLELVVRCCGENNEAGVINELSELIEECRAADSSGNKYPLISRIICICQASKYSRRYYGGSLSCPGNIEREIMTAVSCLHVWHHYVSSAVLSVFLQDTTEPRFPHGIIQLPGSVVCRAFDTAKHFKVLPPCLRCHQLYSLPNHTDHRNAAGNCAETEAISNLLKNEDRVENETQMNGGVLGKMEIEQRVRSHFDTQMNVRMTGRAEATRYDIEQTYN